MSGTGASNLGYGNITPGSNINPAYVNVHNTHDPAIFTSREISGFPGLSGAKWNVDAAKGYDPGICVWKGGFKKKIKNITKMYKMKGGRRKMKTMKRKLMSKRRHVHTKRCKHGGKHVHTKNCKHNCKKGYSNKRSLRGGYAQYQNNLPMTGVYSTGGVLPANQLALANPTPYQPLSNCVNCKDNYNHYTGTGSPSRGH